MVAVEVRAEIELLNAAVAAPGLAAVAIRLAEALDAIDIGDAPTAQAVLADKLTAAMAKLRAFSPPVVEGDAVDDIAEQRKKRRAEAAKRSG